MPPNHKFLKTPKHRALPPKNFDKTPEITIMFDIDKSLRVYSSRSGERCIHTHKVGKESSLQKHIRDYLGYQSNLCEGISQYFDIKYKSEFISFEMDNVKKLIHSDGCDSVFGFLWQSKKRSRGRHCPNCTALLAQLQKKYPIKNSMQNINVNINNTKSDALTDITIKTNNHATMSKSDLDAESNWCLLWQMFLDRWNELNKLYEDNPLRLEFDYDQYYNRLNEMHIKPTANKWQRGKCIYLVVILCFILFVVCINCE
eukprot:51970_1